MVPAQVLAEHGGVNYNPLVTDGLYPYVCEFNSNETLTLLRTATSRSRMVFGGRPTSASTGRASMCSPTCRPRRDCLGGGWEAFGFANQGQCVRFIETGNDSRLG